jgi:hypothetical protein
MNCPKCGGEMWDNRGKKKNPKAPDFRCKNPNCKDEKGYVTGLWESDLEKKAEQVSQKTQKPTQKNGNGRDPKWTLLNTCILTAKDLCNANPDAVMPLANSYYNEAIDILTGKYQPKQIAKAFEGDEQAI